MSTLGQHLASLSPTERIRLEQRLLDARSSQPSGGIERCTGFAHHPLSFAQQRLWFLDRLDPGQSHYNLFRGLRLKGRLDRGALERALAAIVARHESLRTTFVDTPTGPVQIVGDAARFSLSQVDLTGVPDAEAGPLQQILQDETNRPFDLARDLMLRATLIRLSDSEHVLCLVLHHIAADEWSMQIIYHELAEFYAALSGQRSTPPADLPIQYSDFARWQRQALEGPALQSQLAYWRDQLRDAPPVLELPADLARPPVQHFRGARQQRTLSKDLSDRLLALGRDCGTTPFATLLSALSIVISKWTGRHDIVLGTPVAGRNRVELESLIGFFVNTLVLRTDLAGNPTFRELLGRTHDVVLGALAHQDLPFDRLVEELRPERKLNQTPLVQVLLNWINVPRQTPRLAGLSVEKAELPLPGAKFDLTLYAWQHVDNIHLALVYNVDLFCEPRMAALLDQLEQVLDQASRRPDLPIEKVSLATNSAAQFLADPIAPLPSLAAAPAHELFAQQAQRAGGRIAVSDASDAWTYEELNARSNQLARFLIAGGVRPRDYVAIYAHRSASLVWALLGAMKAGASFVILDPALPHLRLQEIIRAAPPNALLQVARAGAPPPQLEQSLAECGYACRLALPPLSEAQSGRLLAEYAAESPPVTVGLDDPLCVSFTSGSTGAPKGIAATHRPLAHFLAWHAQTFALGEQDRFSALSGLSHDPMLRDVLTPLSVGATLVLPTPDASESGQLADWIRRERITVCHLTPQLGRLIAAATPERGPALDSLRYLFFGGDVLSPALVAAMGRAAPRATCVNFYGATETPQAAASFVVGRGDAAGVSVPIGRGIAGTQLLVLNAAGGIAGIGELGEISVRSPHLALGYLSDDALTAERFITNPFTLDPADRIYRTGDLGRYRPDGNVEFVGRSDRQVKVRGFRVELAEVEAVLCCHPSVAQAYVSVDNVDTDVRLFAHVACPQEPRPSAEELRRWLRERLPDFMIPSAIESLERLPLAPNGKIDAAALVRQVRDKQSDPAGAQAPALTELESKIAAIWCDVLGISTIRAHDNFLDLGGHSLLAMRVIARIEVELGLAVTPRTLMFQTLRQIALVHGQRPDAGRAAPSALQPLYFGRAGEELFGCYHPPVGPTTRDCGILLCAPLGHEYVRTHRACCQLARRLSEAGFHVLRFDYFACGDSAGDDGQTSLGRSLDDIAAAAFELRRRSGASGLCLGGLRMGATLAALAAGRRNDVDAVFLCDPVIRGNRYLTELARWHRLKIGSLPNAMRQQDNSSRLETFLGFRFSLAMQDELRRIDLRTATSRPAPRVLLLDTAPRVESRRLSKHLAALGADVDYRVVKDHRIWRPELDKILVPARVIDAVERWLGAVHPHEAGP